MNPDQNSSKLFYEGACGSPATGSDTCQNASSAPDIPILNTLRTSTVGLLAPLALAIMLSQKTYANPMNGNVVSGTAPISSDGNTLTINQTTDKAIISWDSFSIADGETTEFIMPSATAAVLNRVTGIDQSQIDGALNANGQVYLINPNGIVIGSTGVINTQSFIASTLDVDDAAFLAGGSLTFTTDNHDPLIEGNNPTILNLGNITADGGDVFLIARQVTNSNRMTASEGRSGYGSGYECDLAPLWHRRPAVDSERGRNR